MKQVYHLLFESILDIFGFLEEWLSDLLLDLPDSIDPLAAFHCKSLKIQAILLASICPIHLGQLLLEVLGDDVDRASLTMRY